MVGYVEETLTLDRSQNSGGQYRNCLRLTTIFRNQNAWYIACRIPPDTTGHMALIGKDLDILIFRGEAPDPLLHGCLGTCESPWFHLDLAPPPSERSNGPAGSNACASVDMVSPFGRSMQIYFHDASLKQKRKLRSYTHIRTSWFPSHIWGSLHIRMSMGLQEAAGMHSQLPTLKGNNLRSSEQLKLLPCLVGPRYCASSRLPLTS
jgi:hypothetical protein